jgi:hypothetical protein
MRWETALDRTSSGRIRSDAPDALPGPDLQPVELRSISMSADEKATDDRPAALLPMNERRDMLFFFDMRDLLADSYDIDPDTEFLLFTTPKAYRRPLGVVNLP